MALHASALLPALSHVPPQPFLAWWKGHCIIPMGAFLPLWGGWSETQRCLCRACGVGTACPQLPQW